ncbi:hypothetical protein IAU60_005551 [Kwoniella sp. DSM 27419]
MARPKRAASRAAGSTPGRSSPRLSSVKDEGETSPAAPRSGASTPRPSRSTPLRQSATSTPTRGKWVEKQAKTSPYFDKKANGPTKAKAAKGGNGKAALTKGKNGAKARKVKAEEDDEDEDEPTGLTSSESPSSSDDNSEDAFDPDSDEEEDEPIEGDEEEDDEGSVDSDFLDEDEGAKKKRKPTGGKVGQRPGPSKKVKSDGTSKGKSGSVYIEGYEDEDEDDGDVELEEGQELAGRIYPAPKTGQVPPGRISQNTLNFLKNLQIPERNDREWFRSHEPAFRQAEKEWKAFVAIVQNKFHEADDEVPLLPPKDVIHRIYRDVRFSSDKTPYKRNFSMSTSRGGRKGLWAAYHLSISPNNRSLIAAGVWQPGKNELATIRHHLTTNPQQFRDVIEEPQFVELFGEAKEKKGKRQNVFGNDDALKVAPKGVDKDHKDIDLLKLRSVAVVHHLTDEQVIATDFQEHLYDILVVMRPFVRMLNDFISLPPGTGDDGNDQNGDDNDDGGADGASDED